MIRSEQRHDMIPHVTGLSIAVQQNHRTAFAANGVVDSHSIHLDLSLRETVGDFASSSKYGAGQQQSDAGEKVVLGHSHLVFQLRSPRWKARRTETPMLRFTCVLRTPRASRGDQTNGKHATFTTP